VRTIAAAVVHVLTAGHRPGGPRHARCLGSSSTRRGGEDAGGHDLQQDGGRRGHAGAG
jgi:hypothetical protein